MRDCFCMRVEDLEEMCRTLQVKVKGFEDKKVVYERRITVLKRQATEMEEVITKKQTSDAGTQVLRTKIDFKGVQTDLSYQFLEAHPPKDSVVRSCRTKLIKQGSLFVDDPEAARDFHLVWPESKTQPLATPSTQFDTPSLSRPDTSRISGHEWRSGKFGAKPPASSRPHTTRSMSQRHNGSLRSRQREEGNKPSGPWSGDNWYQPKRETSNEKAKRRGTTDHGFSPPRQSPETRRGSVHKDQRYYSPPRDAPLGASGEGWALSSSGDEWSNVRGHQLPNGRSGDGCLQGQPSPRGTGEKWTTTMPEIRVSMDDHQMRLENRRSMDRWSPRFSENGAHVVTPRAHGSLPHSPPARRTADGWSPRRPHQSRRSEV